MTVRSSLSTNVRLRVPQDLGTGRLGLALGTDYLTLPKVQVLGLGPPEITHMHP